MLFSELLRENKRMLDKSIREIERERQGLQAQEKKLIVQIKNTAKQGQMVRDVVRLSIHFPTSISCSSTFLYIINIHSMR